MCLLAEKMCQYIKLNSQRFWNRSRSLGGDDIFSSQLFLFKCWQAPTSAMNHQDTSFISPDTRRPRWKEKPSARHSELPSTWSPKNRIESLPWCPQDASRNSKIPRYWSRNHTYWIFTCAARILRMPNGIYLSVERPARIMSFNPLIP